VGAAALNELREVATGSDQGEARPSHFHLQRGSAGAKTSRDKLPLGSAGGKRGRNELPLGCAGAKASRDKGSEPPLGCAGTKTSRSLPQQQSAGTQPSHDDKTLEQGEFVSTLHDGEDGYRVFGVSFEDAALHGSQIKSQRELHAAVLEILSSRPDFEPIFQGHTAVPKDSSREPADMWHGAGACADRAGQVGRWTECLLRRWRSRI